MAQPRAFIRALAGLLFLAALLAASIASESASVQAAPPQQTIVSVVISQFRTRGPNGQNDQFIELYNPTLSSINISGWVIKDSDSTGGTIRTIATIPASTTLQIGQFYLLADTTSPGYSGTVTPDLPYAMSVPDDGGIALFNGGSIVDQVGMSSTSAYVEPAGGPALTPRTTNIDQSYQRKPGGAQGGCNNTNDNIADFTYIPTSVVPHNLASALGSCRIPATPIPTNTLIPTITLTPTSSFFNPPVIISEIGWAGTPTDSTAQWIELYNPQSKGQDLNGWILAGQYNYPSITLTGTIPPNGYYLLVRSSNYLEATAAPTAPPAPTPAECIVFNPADVSYDQIFYDSLSTYGQTLYLKDPSNFVVDTANFYGFSWPAGSYTNHASMERRGVVPDSPDAWITYGDTVGTVRDCAGNRVFGTPKHQNWAWGLVQTPTPTSAPTKRPTGIPPTPFAHVVINEFLPRPGFDWNNDGVINNYDEFIEIENLGPINVNLSGWKLDNVSGGSHFYSLPAKTLKPGDRAVYFGSDSHIPLYDSGGTVRLINPRGIVMDARGYGIATTPDQSICRIPDGAGYWRFPCFPTPGTENALTGTVPSLPPAVLLNQPTPCLLPDVLPDVFREAACNAYGGDILNGSYWDQLAGLNEFPVPDNYNKTQTTIK